MPKFWDHWYQRAQQWMLLSNTEDARKCYFAWQEAFKQKVEGLKLLHLCRYLARAGGGSAFQAFKFTKATQSSQVDPLYREDRSLSSETEEQAQILFTGTSEPINFPPITLAEVKRALASFPPRIVVGPEDPQ
ncbi:uncharacterized protein VP01_671g2 [Puccinia sorghi]|uniref:Uncharacterized protein n=1 Tax=Puccinia sorghi TaxID=27349 RepID=A0A0L6UFK9_9BASI|nr:uncharacterized protein VP01_671g2 [Puccinia sorghi]